MSNNSLSQEKLFGGRNELQMFPINMMEENNFGDSHDEDYADFGFTDDIDFIDARIDKSLAKERKKVLKEKKERNEKTSAPVKVVETKVISMVPIIECSEVGTVHVHLEDVCDLIPVFINNEIIDEEVKKQLNNPKLEEVYGEVTITNENDVFKKETQTTGRAKLFSENISVLNFCKKYKNCNFVLKYERKLKNAFAKNSKRKSRMRISQWRKVAAML